jgi:pyroglutamyl-peptidase
MAALEAFSARHAADLDVATVTLPVVYGAATEALAQAIASTNPGAVVALGQADGRDCIGVERVALNLVTAEDADEAGRRLTEEPVLRGGPVGYWSTLPVKRIVIGFLHTPCLPEQVTQTGGASMGVETLARAIAITAHACA